MFLRRAKELTFIHNRNAGAESDGSAEPAEGAEGAKGEEPAEPDGGSPAGSEEKKGAAK